LTANDAFFFDASARAPRLRGLASAGDAGSLDDELNAELVARLPMPAHPDPSIAPARVAQHFARGLQRVDSPDENAGLEQAFPWMTFECRKAVTARQGASTVERFIEYGRLSPALMPFMHCEALRWGRPTVTPATTTRGALASFPVEIVRGKGIRYASGFQRSDVKLDEPRDDDEEEEDYTSTRFVVRIQQQRRPPLQGCWLISEVVDVRFAFAGDMGNDIPD
jgi:hypothetical protein